MPSIMKLVRITRLATLPETRRAIIAAARSDTLRDVAHRAATDRYALARDLMDPANARDMLRGAVRHPATRELGSAGLLFMPVRYLPLGWVATWAARRIVGRYVDRPVEVLDPSAMDADRPRRNVTPEARHE
jgi:hypothetical protein